MMDSRDDLLIKKLQVNIVEIFTILNTGIKVKPLQKFFHLFHQENQVLSVSKHSSYPRDPLPCFKHPLWKTAKLCQEKVVLSLEVKTDVFWFSAKTKH